MEQRIRLIDYVESDQTELQHDSITLTKARSPPSRVCRASGIEASVAREACDDKRATASDMELQKNTMKMLLHSTFADVELSGYQLV